MQTRNHGCQNLGRQTSIDQFFLNEKEKQERSVYDRILGYGGEVILNRRNLDADSKAIFGLDFQTLDSVLRTLRSDGIPDVLPPKVLMRTTVTRRPKGWKSHEDSQVLMKIWISSAFKKIQNPKSENLLTP